jgi:multicomponent Na+:H+ antiporter subunit B
LTSSPLRLAARALTPLLLLASVAILARGHHEPGGGFAGGLVAAAALAFSALARGTASVRAWLRVEPERLLVLGLALALSAALLPLLLGRPFFTALWSPHRLPGIGKLGTPLLFDLGVYLVVLGMAGSFLIALVAGEEEQA